MTGQPRSASRRPGRFRRARRAPGSTKICNAIGRPKRIFGRGEVLRLRESGLSIERIAGQMRTGVGTVMRVIQTRTVTTGAFERYPA